MTLRREFRPCFSQGRGRIMLSSISKSLRGMAIGVAAVLVCYAPASAVPANVTYAMTMSFVSPAAGVPVVYGPGR